VLVRVPRAFAPGWLVSGIQPANLTATFIVKGTFRLVHGQSAVLGDVPDPLRGDTPEKGAPELALSYASDFAPVKLRTDLLLTGTCHTPGGRPTEACRAGFRVGSWSKALAVIGDRKWVRALLSSEATQPELFTEMPLSYTRALGGPNHDRNPIGRGIGTDSLPNIEWIDRRVGSPGDRTEPAGFGPMHPTLPQRNRNLGTYDRRWLRERWPWPPADFDWSYHNAAPPDQQLDGFLRGDEEIALENMHPTHASYTCRLPGLRPQVFLVETIDASKRAREVPLVLDTLWVDADEEKLVLVWRGLAVVRSLKLVELDEVHVAATNLQEVPLTWTRYHADVQAREQQEQEEAAAASALEAEEDRKFEAEFAQLRAESDKIVAAATKEAEVARERSLHMLAEDGIDRTVFLTPRAQPPPALEETLAGVMDDAPQLAEQVLAMLPAWDPAVAAPDDPEWTRELCQQQAAAGGSLSEADLAGLDLSNLDLSGADLRRASLRGCLLVNAVLTKARLSAADVSKADFSGADLSDADLENIDGTGATFTGATLSRARLIRATMVKAMLANADLSGVDATAADFSAADLTCVRAVEADLEKADLSGAKLEGAVLAGACLAHATVERAHGPNVSMSGADLTGLHAGNAPDFTGGDFTGVGADGSYWEGAQLDGADFRSAALARAAFPFASLRGARFDAANIPKGCFDDANLERAVFTEANLFQGSLERARLHGADLRLVNLFEAEVWDAQLEAARLEGANLKMTKIAAR
jgi:uncharacterized protein YjbI with pentapeptide repeats